MKEYTLFKCPNSASVNPASGILTGVIFLQCALAQQPSSLPANQPQHCLSGPLARAKIQAACGVDPQWKGDVGVPQRKTQ